MKDAVSCLIDKERQQSRFILLSTKRRSLK